MRHRVLVSLVLLVCSCSKIGDEAKNVLSSKSAIDSATAQPVALAKPLPAPPALPPRALRCGLRPSSRITELGIGELQVGQTVAAIKQNCMVIRDAAGPGHEGNTERLLTVLLGSDRVVAAVVDGLVWRITISTPRFRTADGLGVGTPLYGFAAAKGLRMEEGEDGLYLKLPSHCGLSFLFAIQSRAQPGKPWPTTRLAQLHGDARVDRILVTRCVR
jgi:hypothetical protein